MAEVAAPVKAAAKKQQELPGKGSMRQYTFQMIEKFPNHGEGQTGNAFIPRNTDFPVFWGASNQDDIYWPYIDGKPVALSYEIKADDEVEYLPRTIRYVSGAASIFVDEQEANTEAYKLDVNGRNRLLENPANKNHLTFSQGELTVEAANRNLWNYLWCMNQCKNQNPKAQIPDPNRGPSKRAKAINPKFQLLNPALSGKQKVVLGEEKDKALEMAKTARVEEMLAHAKYLGIQFNYAGTEDLKSVDEVRAEYKEYAWAKPETFLKTFSDPKIKIVYQISNLLEQNEITLQKTPGQAHWVNTGAFIAVIPPEVKPIDFLADFAMTKDGEEFMKLLRAFK